MGVCSSEACVFFFARCLRCVCIGFDIQKKCLLSFVHSLFSTLTALKLLQIGNNDNTASLISSYWRLAIVLPSQTSP